MVRAVVVIAAVIGAVLGFPGCSPVYVMRAGYEEARILWAREPIATVLERDTLSAERRAKLRLVLDAREFAGDELGLTVDGCYASVSDVDDPAVLHVVSAAERFALQPYTWWFPIVGRVPYKGFFDVERARRAARELEREGYDTYVRTAGGFSTLGWFDDPLLSSQLRMEPSDLANLVIHELLHSTSYTAGNAGFAESFASFVGFRGAAEFFARRGDAATAREIEDEWHDAVAFSSFLDVAVARLESAFAAGVSLEERNRLYEEIQQDWAATPRRTLRYARFADRALNNAILLQLRVYHRELGLFDALLDHYAGDLRRTIATVIGATENASDPFSELNELLADSFPGSAASGLEAAQTVDSHAARNHEGPGAESRGRRE